MKENMEGKQNMGMEIGPLKKRFCFVRLVSETTVESVDYIFFCI
jgi:hypothetical protein